MTKLPLHFKSLSPEAGLAIVKRSCESKRRYQTQKVAQWTLGNHENAKELEVYHCKFCGGWHIAHSKTT